MSFKQQHTFGGYLARITLETPNEAAPTTIAIPTKRGIACTRENPVLIRNPIRPERSRIRTPPLATQMLFDSRLLASGFRFLFDHIPRVMEDK